MIIFTIKRIVFCIFFLPAVFFAAMLNPLNRLPFDTRSLDQFWKVQEILLSAGSQLRKNGRTYSSSPCYAFLKKDNFYKKLFRLAYKPGLNDSLTLALAGNDYTAKALVHLATAMNEKQHLQSFVHSFDNKRIRKALPIQLHYCRGVLPAGIKLGPCISCHF
ncbi:MAG: hypothetical protein WDO71_28290 [Bacteroidota bacterium]